MPSHSLPRIKSLKLTFTVFGIVIFYLSDTGQMDLTVIWSILEHLSSFQPQLFRRKLNWNLTGIVNVGHFRILFVNPFWPQHLSGNLYSTLIPALFQLTLMITPFPHSPLTFLDHTRNMCNVCGWHCSIRWSLYAEHILPFLYIR